MDKAHARIALLQMSKSPFDLHLLQAYVKAKLFEYLFDFGSTALIPQRKRKLLQAEAFDALFRTRPPDEVVVGGDGDALNDAA